jgi:glutamine amidotransferase-like uncharacterized protein
MLGVCAGGFTGALALSEDAPAGLFVVAAGALALAAGAAAAAPIFAAWLLVQESEIILIELTCKEPSFARDPCIWT